MNIRKATTSYEGWMSGHIPTVTADLRYKHAQMAQSPFAFMRATFYRWMQLWKELCADASRAPGVLAVGDLHVENFGTRSEEHTSELQSQSNLVCRLLLEKKKYKKQQSIYYNVFSR